MTQEDVVYNDLPLYHVGGAFANVARAAYAGCTVGLWDKFSPQQFWKRIKACQASSTILLDVMIPWLMNAEPSPEDRNNTLNKIHMQPLPKYHNEVAKRFGFRLRNSWIWSNGVRESSHKSHPRIGGGRRDTRSTYIRDLSREEIIARRRKI